jgi:membrane-bound lytic murein transglycosylase B
MISELTRDQGFAEEQLTSVFADAVRKQAILDAISRPS